MADASTSTNPDLGFATATELAAAIRERKLSSLEVVDHLLARIERHNPALNAIVTLDAEGAREKARTADAATARGETMGPLHGVPYTLKDGNSTAGMRTTAGYLLLENHVPTEDGAVAARLKQAGGILMGKTNVPPLLAWPQTENRIFGRTSNPWDLGRTPGGSSGGAAAALAAGLTPIEVGSDMAGSIRMPAHFCGVFGLKPTSGRIPYTGHIPDLPGFPRSDRVLATCGPMARSAGDLALMFKLLAGPDGRDTEIAPVPVIDPPPVSPKTLRIAWAPTFPNVPCARSIRETVATLALKLVPLVSQVEERLPDLSFEEQDALWSEYYKGFRYLAARVWRSRPPVDADPSEPPTALDLMRINERRDTLILAWERFFEDWDVLLCPAALVTAFPHAPVGTPFDVDGEPAKYGQINHHTYAFNISGHPAAVVPIARDANGLPIGVQVVTRRWQDERLLSIVAWLAEVAGPFPRPPGY